MFYQIKLISYAQRFKSPFWLISHGYATEEEPEPNILLHGKESHKWLVSIALDMTRRLAICPIELPPLKSAYIDFSFNYDF